MQTATGYVRGGLLQATRFRSVPSVTSFVITSIPFWLFLESPMRRVLTDHLDTVSKGGINFFSRIPNRVNSPVYLPSTTALANLQLSAPSRRCGLLIGGMLWFEI